jgi:hypothetical protein
MSAADDLRALSAAATPGPWRLNDSEHYRAPQVLMAPGEGGVRISGLRDSADADSSCGAATTPTPWPT